MGHSKKNIYITRIPGKQKETETESIFKAIMVENILNVSREMDIQIHEAQRTTNRFNTNRATPRHTAIKLSKIKDKDRISRAAREKREVTYKVTPIRLLADF